MFIRRQYAKASLRSNVGAQLRFMNLFVVASQHFIALPAAGIWECEGYFRSVWEAGFMASMPLVLCIFHGRCFSRIGIIRSLPATVLQTHVAEFVD